MDDSDENSPEDNEDMDEDSNGTHRPVNPPLLVLDNDDPANTLRILISTDNHLGYAERDAIRGMDSFAALEEVLYLAKSRFACDLVLLAGDLFHDNRPSRRTLHKTMEILRRHCLGPNPVRVQILSADPNKRNGQKKHNATNTSKTSATATTSNNATTTSNNNNANPPASSWVNYQDPYYSIDMPIFSIHGNHDDPSRDPGGGELLAALGE